MGTNLGAKLLPDGFHAVAAVEKQLIVDSPHDILVPVGTTLTSRNCLLSEFLHVISISILV